ncbi:ABC transporter permease [Pseudomonas sp. NBRC 111118]|uniref:ABC transporter permease n=1 Tax=Pseudomonas sp. NBRC 111118 TaxID=1661033 RepID=UPI0006D3D533|nr:ABC transporter permease [Pseudomonas sp. NBRC 111118]
MNSLDKMVEWLQAYWSEVIYLSIQHLHIVAVSSALAIVIALPIGVWMSRPRNQRYALATMQVLNIGQAVPKLALLALAMTLVGVGAPAAIFALWVATILPITVNTYEGLRAVPRHLLEAAEAVGMTPREILFKVEIPNAMIVIFAGLRTALAINVGTAPLAFLVGGGGLGELIFTGIDLNDYGMMLAGAIATAGLAMLVDMLCGLVQHVSVSRGLRLAAR